MNKLDLDNLDNVPASDADDPARRDFMRLALAAIPATGLLAHCAAGADAHDPDQAADVSMSQQALLDECPDAAARSRRLQLHATHIGAENQHDLAGITESFGSTATMIVNDRTFSDAQSIADAHVLFGMSDAAGGLSDTQVVPDRELVTDDELLVYGRVIGTHSGQVLHFPPTFRRVELHYAAFYRFDGSGKLHSERIVMNWAPLAGA